MVLAGSEGESWCAAAREAGASLGLTVDAFRIGADLIARDGGLEELLGTGSGGALLVRPDGFVAWRSARSSTEARDQLGQALASALARA